MIIKMFPVILLFFVLNGNILTGVGIEAKEKTLLHIAVENSNLDDVNYLLEHNARVNAQDNFDATPLHIAAEKSNVQIAEQLIQNNANVNAQDDKGMTPLRIAFAFGNITTVALLLCYGADKTIADNNGQSPQSLALEALADQYILQGNSRLDNKPTSEEHFTLIQDIIHNPEAATQKERFQVLDLFLQNPGLPHSLLTSGQMMKNARKI